MIHVGCKMTSWFKKAQVFSKGNMNFYDPRNFPYAFNVPGPSGAQQHDFSHPLMYGEPSNAGRSCTPFSMYSTSGSPDSTGSSSSGSPTIEGENTKKQKSTYDKWPHSEQQYLVRLWADRHYQLESKDNRKVWDEIVRELNAKFNTKRIVEKCKAKIKYLIEKYKAAKDWNAKQSGGNRKESLFYEEIDAVLGCRDIVTLRHVAEAGDSKNSDNFAENGTEEIETSPANRAERKRKRKREEEEEKKEEERKLMRAALSTFEEQR